MEIERLPDHLCGQAIELWHEVELTRPWNDPEADLRKAMAGPASTVLAGIDNDALLATRAGLRDGGRRAARAAYWHGA